MANNFLPTGFTVTSTFQALSTLLDSAGITAAANGFITSQDGYIKNNDTAIDLYVGQGTSAPSNWATIGPESAILFEAGLNTSLVWLKCASSTITVDFVEGANSYNPPLVNGVIGTLTATENVVPKADSSGNLVASTISDDASTVSIAADVAVTGTVTSDDATTPGFTVESGNTNTGFVDIKGKTSGKIRITTADATAQTVNITAAAQTSGASTITIPDLAGASTGLATTTVAQTFTNKTLTAPVLNTGTVGTSLVPTTDDGAALGDTTHNFSDLFLASGAVINFANGNEVLTHSSGILTVTTGDLRVTTAGTNTASVVTVGGTQTLAAKTLTTPVIGVATGTSLAVTGLLTSSSPTAGIGYATGAGGAVTQATSRTTGVTLNTLAGAITLVSAAGSATPFSFTVTNSAVAATDTIHLSQKSGTDIYTTQVISAVGAGSFRITLANASGTTTEQPVFNFAVIKAVAA